MKSPRTAEAAAASIGNRAKRRRGTRPQVEVATAAGMNQSTLSRIETGRYPGLTPEMILRLCLALGCQPSDLLDGLDDVIIIARDEAAQAVA